MDNTREIKNLFNELTEDEKQLYHDLKLENFIRKTIINVVKSKTELHENIIGKYQKIEALAKNSNLQDVLNAGRFYLYKLDINMEKNSLEIMNVQ